jgi:hypothetical protein
MQPQRLERRLERRQPADRTGQHVGVARVEIRADTAQRVSEVVEGGEHVEHPIEHMFALSTECPRESSGHRS